MLTKKNILIIGDILSIAILTVIGFATHGEVGFSFVLRMGTTFFPLAFAWFLSAPWFGLFDEQVTSNPRLLWRIFIAMLFAAPLAVILRAALLHGAASSLFVLILGSMNALGLLVWRGSYLFIARRMGILPG
ncbi:MAG: DUF3054 domain-containing protein [Chloroflexi bacterium]|nr:DUF3054 domain-containing protein [Chloroflexota bacterium]